MAKAGNYDKALEIANSLQDQYVKLSALVMIAGEMAKAGKLDKAIDVANSLQEKSGKTSVSRNVSRRDSKGW